MPFREILNQGTGLANCSPTLVILNHGPSPGRDAHILGDSTPLVKGISTSCHRPTFLVSNGASVTWLHTQHPPQTSYLFIGLTKNEKNRKKLEVQEQDSFHRGK